MKVNLTLLGTGTSGGVPMIGCSCKVCSSNDFRDYRLRTSAMLDIETDEGKSVRIVIDVGPDFRQQMLHHNVCHIDAVLLTHEHRDHIGGMDDLRSYYYLQGDPVSVYCLERVSRVIRKDFDYAFSANHHGFAAVPRFNLHDVLPSEKFSVCGVEVIPISVMHDRLEILGFRIGDLTYITDASFIEESSMELIYGTKILVINALRHKPHYSHFSLNKALSVIKKISPERAILTHISHKMGLYDSLKEKMPCGVEIGFDNLKDFC